MGAQESLFLCSAALHCQQPPSEGHVREERLGPGFPVLKIRDSQMRTEPISPMPGPGPLSHALLLALGLFGGDWSFGMSQRPLTLILLQKYRDTNGRRIVIQIGGIYTTLCQEKGILLQKYRDINGRCIAILFKSIGVRGQFDSPEHWRLHFLTQDLGSRPV